MTTWIGLLRGVNVGGHHRLPMATLRALVEDAGGSDVATLIQSGNVVFAHALAEREPLRDMLETQLAERCGFPVPVVLRSIGDWRAMIARCPFPDAPAAHVAFLRTPPRADAADVLAAAAVGGERFLVTDTEVHLDLPEGGAHSRLAAALDRLGTVATTRNWRTVGRLAELATGRG